MYDAVCKSNVKFSFLSEGNKLIVLMTFQEKGIMHCLAKKFCMSAKLKAVDTIGNYSK